jgi:hypothetical protein
VFTTCRKGWRMQPVRCAGGPPAAVKAAHV